MTEYEVSSEIYKETDFKTVKTKDGRHISKFSFTYPSENEKESVKVDDDGDLIVQRKKEGVIEIEHSSSTVLKLVGLQVWRGALLLADYFLYKREEFKDKCILEVGAGVGLTSIVAGIYCKKVICTDVDMGGILDLIRSNVAKNRQLLRNNIDVMELDFCKEFSKDLQMQLAAVDIVMAADVIYDDDLTDGFVKVLENLLDKENRVSKTIFIALEKRYVFTLAELDTSAPCFDYFLKKIKGKSWKVTYIPTDFPQYFSYERCKELVLLSIMKM